MLEFRNYRPNWSVKSIVIRLGRLQHEDHKWSPSMWQSSAPLQRDSC